MGLSFIPHDINIDFIGRRYLFFAISGLFIVAGLISLAMKGGPAYGIDFAGGMVVQARFAQSVDVGELRKAVESTGLPGVVVQDFGKDASGHSFLIRTSDHGMKTDEARALVTASLKDKLKVENFEIQRLEMVGPKVGADLRAKALEAMFYAILLISIYISGRFEQRWMAAGLMAGGLAIGIYALKLMGAPMSWLIFAAVVINLALCVYLRLLYALGTVVALIHDVLITVGIFSILNKEFDLTVIAAILTLIGYSMNDTIIVFDRIRENVRNKYSKSFAKTINASINQTLSRTILTSGLTLLVVLSLYLFGGTVINDFALALLIGIVVGTYSSIFVASPILLFFTHEAPDEREMVSKPVKA